MSESSLVKVAGVKIKWSCGKMLNCDFSLQKFSASGENFSRCSSRTQAGGMCGVKSATHHSLPGDIGRGYFNVFPKLFLHSILYVNRTWIPKSVVMLALSLIPVSCVPVEPLQLSKSLTTTLGVGKYQDTGEQFSLTEYIPDSPRLMSRLSSWPSPLVPSLLCCNVYNEL